jgi:hypothetical protein
MPSLFPADQYVAYYLEHLRRGRAEDAFFGLIDADPAVLPVLMDAFAREENRGICADIVRCIWQHRRPEALGFLADLLHDPDPAVWQEALDGLVALGGDEAVGSLQAARTRILAKRVGQSVAVQWIDEALEQLGSA